MCGTPLAPAGRGRPPVYCSQACRARAYRARRAAPSAGRSAAEPAAPVPHTAGNAPGGSAQGAAERPLERIVRAAIRVADRDGLDGLTMRQVAAALAMPPMSLYGHLDGRERLVELMADAVFAERPLPEPGPPGWRAKLELSGRQEWAIYRAHPWAALLIADTTRPPIGAGIMAYTDWRMRAVDGLGLDFTTMVRIAVGVSSHLQGAAVSLARQTRSAKDLGSPRSRWVEEREPEIRRLLRSAGLTMVERFDETAYRATEPDAVFEFALATTLDGVAALLGGA
ncbi:hypothetical protein BIV57_18185 [Mangrovactinospora gilvigrisea]|uniref:HTH tetR-type domain-containing protein n=2 Tax=Mangrovactinospora gilvigrisea TaxID=1428644 RepID=A0A1J7BRL9_9ACTN|nr:hypothetical protein BIV57_18185 [Mangrovactinospora gilvigrisea]